MKDGNPDACPWIAPTHPYIFAICRSCDRFWTRTLMEVNVPPPAMDTILWSSGRLWAKLTAATWSLYFEKLASLKTLIARSCFLAFRLAQVSRSLHLVVVECCKTPPRWGRLAAAGAGPGTGITGLNLASSLASLESLESRSESNMNSELSLERHIHMCHCRFGGNVFSFWCGNYDPSNPGYYFFFLLFLFFSVSYYY